MKRNSGQAVIESILLGLVLLIPLIWLLGVLADVHRGALATTAAAREAGADAARQVDPAAAARAVDGAVARALSDHGIAPEEARVRWAAGRLERGGIVEVTVSYPVVVGQAPLLGRVGGPALWVRAHHVARIDPYRSR